MNKHLILSLLATIICTASLAQTLIPFRNEKGLWGFKNKNGQILINPDYYYKPEPFSEGRSVVMKIYNQRGVIDESGKLVVPLKYNKISSFKNGFATVTTEYLDSAKKSFGQPTRIVLKGIIDRNGAEIVPVKFKNLQGDFSNGWFVVADTGGRNKYYFDTKGQLFDVPAELTLMVDSVDGKVFIAHKNYKYGLIDRNFKEVLPFEYQHIRPAGAAGLLIVRKNNKTGLMDSKLKWVLEPKYYTISKFENGYASFADSSKLVGAINTKGKITVAPEFESIHRIEKTYSTLAVFKRPRNDNAGLIDLATGKIALSNNYQFGAHSYEYGLISYRKDNKKMLIDSTGRTIFNGEYDDFVTGSKEGIHWIRKDGKYGFMTQTGKVIVTPQYESVLAFSESMAAVKSNGLYGFIDRTGKLVIAQQYLEAGSFEGGVARVKDKSNRVFYIKPDGSELKAP